MKPQITITNKEIRILTDQFTLNLEMTQAIEQKVIIPPLNNEQIKTPAAATPKKPISIRNSVTKKSRKCKKCGQEFFPAGNRQAYCSIECGLKPKPIKEKIRQLKNLSKKEKEELETTLKEIEENNKKPYEINK